MWILANFLITVIRKGPLELIIRDARPEDAGGIAGLSDRAIFHVAVRTHDDTIVGFQSMEPFATYTRSFQHVGVLGTYVDLSRCRRGIAACLFQALFRSAPSKGYEKIFTFIRADNRAALATYQHFGFRIVGTAERQAKLQDSYIDEVIVERML